MLGQSAQNITRGGNGFCWFPTGPEDLRYTYGFKWEKHRVQAAEEVRIYREILMLDGEIQIVKENTPVETKPLGYIYDDYTVQPYTGAEGRYSIGTAAFVADSALPSDFIADRIWLLATTNCLVRFEANTRVQHLLIANIQYFYPRRCKEIFIVQQAALGTLTIRAFGNEVGV